MGHLVITRVIGADRSGHAALGPKRVQRVEVHRAPRAQHTRAFAQVARTEPARLRIDDASAGYPPSSSADSL